MFLKFLVTLHLILDRLSSLSVQREFERKAAIMGGGNFVVPVQTVTDFLNSKLPGKSSL